MSLVGGYSQAAYATADTVYSSYYQQRYEPSSAVAETQYYPSAWSYSGSPNMSPASTEYSPPPGYASSPGQMSSGQLVAGQGELVISSDGSVRVVKRRVTANRKERRRTLSINTAFAELRECIPNVPADTKLSKIKTLRLATSYIAYLMDLLAQDEPGGAPEGGFKAELTKKLESREERRRKEINAMRDGTWRTDYYSSTTHNYLGLHNTDNCPVNKATLIANNGTEKKSKGRTGWPQHVWALELKHDN